jgi:aspartyl-tRNA(Asn)/glutamyl-tRNA(Gln) amidotransferase subunit A
VVGFKPSYKRVPTAGGEGFGTLSNLGPIARCVADAARMLTVMAQGCRNDWQGMESCGTDYAAGLDGDLRGLKVGFSRDLGIVELAPGVAAPVDAAVRVLADLGAEIEDIEVPAMADYLERSIHGIQWIVAMARMVDNMTPEQREMLDPDLLELARAGADIPTQVYVGALVGREKLAAEMHRLLLQYDLLVTPTFHVPAPAAPGLPQELRGPPPLTSWCNQTMQPAATVPCGFTPEGLPVGVQFIARRYADTLVLRAAAVYEAARGPFPIPPL